MSFYKEVPGLQTTLESALKFDTKPTAGSTNPVTSEGIANAIAGASGALDERLTAVEDCIPDTAGAGNKLVTQSAFDAAEAGWQAGYTPKGEASVSTLNGLTGQSNGDTYILTDSGTLTDGSLAVSAGDSVAWDDANSKWYKVSQYALEQYGTDEIHNLSTTITAFRTGDVIPVDGPSGPAKMSKDDLLKETAENAFKRELDSNFDISETNVDEYYFAINVTAGSQAHNFVLVTKSLNIGDKVKCRIVNGTGHVSRFALGAFQNPDNTGSWVRLSDYASADGNWHTITVTTANTSGKFGCWIDGTSVSASGSISFDIVPNYDSTLEEKFETIDTIVNGIEENLENTNTKVNELFGIETRTQDIAVTSGTQSFQFVLLSATLAVGSYIKVRLNESVDCVSRFALGCFSQAGDTGSWVRMTDYANADGNWHVLKILNTNPSGHFGWWIDANRVTANGTISMSVILDYEDTLSYEVQELEERVDSIEDELEPKATTAQFNVTAGTNAYNFTLFTKLLNVGDEVKVRIVEGDADITRFSLGCFSQAGDTGSWVNMCDSYARADGEWHTLTIARANPSGHFGSWINGDSIYASGQISFEVKLNYEGSLRQELDKDEEDIAALQNASLSKQFDGILKTSEDEPLTSVSESGGLAGIFTQFGFLGDSLCSGAVAYNDGSWHYPERYTTSWGQYMCRDIGSSGVNWSYSGVKTESWIESFINLNTAGYSPDNADNIFMTNKKKAYIVALGTNDVNQSVAVGDVDTDIDMDNPENYAHTFAGQYGYIIQKIKEVQPSAKIFVVTIPSIWQGQAESLGYNDVIRAMATKFTNVFVIDFYAYLPTGAKITSDYVYQGHMTTQGYKWISMAMATYIDYIVRTTPASFKNVALIGHSSDHGQY